MFKLNITDELLVILAHPYRDHVQFPNLDNVIIDRLDAIELNSKDAYKNGIDEMKEKNNRISQKT